MEFEEFDEKKKLTVVPGRGLNTFRYFLFRRGVVVSELGIENSKYLGEICHRQKTIFKRRLSGTFRQCIVDVEGLLKTIFKRRLNQKFRQWA